jgi:lipopolysaccharide export system permease protein
MNSDGEIVALLASGMGLYQIARPILMFGAFVCVVTTFCGVNLESWGRREFYNFVYKKSQTELDNTIKVKVQPGVFMNDFLQYTFYAEKISSDRVDYTNVILSPNRDSHSNDGAFLLTAPFGKILGSVKDNNLVLRLNNGILFSSTPQTLKNKLLRYQQMDIDLIALFHEQILGNDTKRDDYRSYTPVELYKSISALETKPNFQENSLYLKSRFLWHSRISNSFVIFGFALLGIVFGVQSQRRTRSPGYTMTIAAVIIFSTITGIFRWLSEQGYLHVYLGAWLPQIIVLGVGLFIFHQKHKLPLGR